MADVGEVNPTHPIWPTRPDERPPGKRRREEEDKDAPERPDREEPEKEEDGDKPGDDGHIDVFVSGMPALERAPSRDTHAVFLVPDRRPC